MYKIIGGDGNEYGPVSAGTMRQWIAESRVNGETKVRGETGDWKTLAEFPELMAAPGAPAAVQPQLKMAGAAAPEPFPTADSEAVFEGDYELDMGGCIARGWALLKANFGVLFGALMIYIGVEILIGVLGVIPLIGMLFSMANWVIAGPLMGGLLYLFLRVVRGEAASAGDVFDGFRKAFAQLFLGQLVTGLLMGLCLLPAVAVGIIILLPSITHHATPEMPQLIMVGGVALLCVIPMIYLQVNWLFSLPLILDKGLEFWPAMKTSWRRVNVHWWHCFGLVVLTGLLNLLGLLLCFVGIFVTMPIGLAALMYAYETIFSGNDAPAA
jgi:hypothetical protein